MLDVEVDALLVRVHSDLDCIVYGPALRSDAFSSMILLYLPLDGDQDIE